jgi:hypothetical protein
MSKQSASGRTPEDMARLRAAMDIPDEPGEDDEFPWDGPEVQRDASGKILKRPLGKLRTAILNSLDHHQMTRYELWKKAHAYCHTLTASAVYEYLRGTREIKSEYVEALMEAVKLKIVNQRVSKEKTPTAIPSDKETLKGTDILNGLLKKKVNRKSPYALSVGCDQADSEGGKSPYSKGPKGRNRSKEKSKPPIMVAASNLTQPAIKPVGLKGSQSTKSAKTRKK